jgi:hypothetical protein
MNGNIPGREQGMVLKFVNSFFALYYVAFFKERDAESSEST